MGHADIKCIVWKWVDIRYLYKYPYHNISVGKPEAALMSFVNVYL